MGRLAYLDNLKVVLVTGVIATHTGITYGVDGSWYLESYDPLSGPASDALTALVGIGFLFGMGLFFLVAGRLTSPSLERKGPRPFLRDRLVRLGIPLVLYTLLISPVLEYASDRSEGSDQGFWSFVREEFWDLAPGPMWFVEALLVFSALYAAWRVVRGRQGSARPERPERLHGYHLAVLAALIGASSFAIHFVFPIGSEQFHLQLALLPQYVILFAFGTACGRRGWLESISQELARKCGIVAGLAALALPALLFAGGFFSGEEDAFAGGMHWQALGGAAFEGVLATCASLWAIVFFRTRLGGQAPLVREMGRGAYAAYFLHPPIIVGLALAIHELALPAGLMLTAVLAVGTALSFGLASALIRLPHVGQIFGSWSARPRTSLT